MVGGGGCVVVVVVGNKTMNRIYKVAEKYAFRGASDSERREMRSTSIRGASASERRECESVDAVFWENSPLKCVFLVKEKHVSPGCGTHNTSSD